MTYEASRRVVAALLAVFAAVALASCSSDTAQEETTSSGDGSTSGSSSSGETTMQTPEMTGEEMVGEGEVTVGGFVVSSPGVPESSVPEVTVRPEEAQAYLDDVRPIVEGTVLDISNLVEPEVGLQDGNLTLDLNVQSLDEATASVEDGVEQLRQVDPPESLEPLNDQLLAAYEDAAPAYQNIVDAAQNGDPQQLADVVQDGLQQVDAFDEEVSSIINDLEEAAGQAGSQQ